MQRFDDDKGKDCEAYIQQQCGMIAFFDALFFPGAKVLRNIRRDRIADGYKNQRKHILHPHRRRIAREGLCAEGVDDRLHEHHADGHGRLLKDRRDSDLKHGTQLLPVKPVKSALVAPHSPKKEQKRQHSGNALRDQCRKRRAEHAEAKTGHHPEIHEDIEDGRKDQQSQRNF